MLSVSHKLFKRRTRIEEGHSSCYEEKERQTEAQADFYSCCSSDTIGKEEEDG
jgi:hypothetical protein